MGIVESFNQLSKVSDHGLLTSFTDSEIWRSITADFFQTLPVLVKSFFSSINPTVSLSVLSDIFSQKLLPLISFSSLFFFFFTYFFPLISSLFVSCYCNTLYPYTLLSSFPKSYTCPENKA